MFQNINKELLYMANSTVFSSNPEALQAEPFGESLGGFWPEPGSLTTTTTIGDITNFNIDTIG